jgi:ribosomal protein L11 methyltransferase
VRVPAEEAERARAVMIDLFPEGFEEVTRGASVELAAYANADGAARLWRAFGEVSSREIPDDWRDRWRLFHRPVRVGALWIGPPWEQPPPDALPVVIDPGRAFGTGAHETTRLCLELLQDAARGPLLDIGCGSVVLAIAAARLGFAPVTAIDHDPTAVDASRRNVAANAVHVRVELLDAVGGDVPRAAVAVANLSRAAVESVAARLDVPVLITSGYLAGEVPDLPSYRRVERRTERGWAADLLRRGR